MAVIINELELVLEPPPPQAQPGGAALPQKPQMSPQDLISMHERELRNRLRLQAH